MLERMLIEHAAPTLARIKMGNLLQLTIRDDAEFTGEVERLSAQLTCKGLQLTVLHRSGVRALVYLYRPDKLAAVLECPRVQKLLQHNGYTDLCVDGALQHLRSRLQEEEFPHEIGVFLGYPIADVESFIENGGRDCAVCGCWKAYHNVCEAQRIFAQYAKCREVYMRLFARGCSLDRLTVAA